MSFNLYQKDVPEMLGQKPSIKVRTNAAQCSSKQKDRRVINTINPNEERLSYR